MATKFRPIRGLTIYNREKAWPGYTVIVPTNEDLRLGRDLKAYMYLINMEGQIVHQWTASTATQLIKLMPDGTAYYMTRDRSNIDQAGLYRLAPDSTIIWQYHCRIDHDFWPYENGNILIHTIDDHMCPALGNELRRHPYFVEITPQKELVWSWRGEEHLQELTDLLGMKFPIDWEARCREEIEQRRAWNTSLQNSSPSEIEDAVQRLIRSYSFDWAHNNTCQVIGENPTAQRDPRFRPGNIIFSYRTLDIIGVIDRQTGRIVWAWGPGIIQGQHKPHMLPNGNILIFDNGTSRGWSRVIELDPVENRIVWEYTGTPRESFFSPAISGAQRLPNGNTLICEGGPGHNYFGGDARIFEVTPEKEIVWEFRNPFRGFINGREHTNVYRAMRYDEEYVAPLFAQ
ncbi:MAG: aryl-sulfate sulfotransferase [Chloroflexi bacterium]|nr:aryl-sulfate sulfotransferase [Chloroflexota bacterium]